MTKISPENGARLGDQCDVDRRKKLGARRVRRLSCFPTATQPIGIVKLVSDDADPRTQPDFWIDQALDLARSGETEKLVGAMACARRAVNMAPHCAIALLTLGSILTQVEKYDEAEVWLKKGIQLASTDTSSLIPSRQEMLPGSDNTDYQPQSRPRVVLKPPPPRDRKAELKDILDSLGRGVGLYSLDEIIEAAQELKKDRHTQQNFEDNLGLMRMANLMRADKDLGHYEAARMVSGEPSNIERVTRRLDRKFKKAATRYLENRFTIDDLFMGHSKSFVKQFTDTDLLNFELMYLDMCRPGYLRGSAASFPNDVNNPTSRLRTKIDQKKSVASSERLP